MLENVTLTKHHVRSENIDRVEPYGYRASKAFSHEGSDPKVWPCDVWSVTLSYKDRSYTTEYRTGIGHRKTSSDTRGFYKEHSTVKIEVKDMLECLFCDAGSGNESFADFAENMGTTTDSRKALDTYLQCQATATALRRLLGADYSAIYEEVHS